MSHEFQRLGALRGALVVAVAAALAMIAFSLSGLSVAAGGHTVATVRPEVPTPAPVHASAPSRRAATHRRHRARATAPARKHCRPVDGVDFTVSVDRPCPKPLKRSRSGPHISKQLRAAASRPRLTVVAPGKAKRPTQTTQPTKPAEAAKAKKAKDAVSATGGTLSRRPGSGSTGSD